METNSVVNNYEKMKQALRRRPVIDYNFLQGGQHVHENFDKNNISVRPSLPKGVIRGCSECSTCQKVIARWHPEDSCKPDLGDAPVFHLSEEEFEHTLNYIASISPIAEPYGICRIVPPPSWKPPCPLKELHVWESAKFSTHVQRVDKLQNCNSTKSSQPPGHTRKKRRRRMGAGAECSSGGDTSLASDEARLSDVDTFGFELGPQFTLDAFQKYADDFKTHYFMKNDCGVDSIGNMVPLKDQFDPSVEDIEGEYWRVVQKPTEEIEVLYGADLESGKFCSGFPKMSSQDSPAHLEQLQQSS